MPSSVTFPFAVETPLFCGPSSSSRRQRGNLSDNWGPIGDTVNGAFLALVVLLQTLLSRTQQLS